MTVSVEISDDLAERLTRIADSHDRPARVELETAVREYLERNDARADFLREAQESWESYQRTGLHITGEEMRDWLRRWGESGPIDPPVCHK